MLEGAWRIFAPLINHCIQYIVYTLYKHLAKTNKVNFLLRAYPGKLQCTKEPFSYNALSDQCP